VASAESDPRPGEFEQALLAWENPARPPVKSLILLHRDGRKRAVLGRQWLESQTVTNIYHARADYPEDVARLARILSGQAIGLALGGGGGGRGLAHIGVIRALEEAGIPITLLAEPASVL
jgi:NTE family protein